LQQDKIARCVCFIYKIILIDRALHLRIAENKWRDVHPSLEDMPEMWPGTGLDRGLRDEHLAPNCKYFPYSFKYKF
jgi:hypothetical protein